MATLSITQLYSALSESVGKESAEVMTSFIEMKTSSMLDERLKSLATKEDIASLRGEIKSSISESKAEMIKWMFIFWGGQLIATFGFILLFVNKINQV